MRDFLIRDFLLESDQNSSGAEIWKMKRRLLRMKADG